MGHEETCESRSGEVTVEVSAKGRALEPGSVQAHGTSAPDTDGALAVVHLDPIDALSVGQSLRTLARHQRTPPGTRAFYDRVGTKLAQAGRDALAAIAKRGGQ